MSNIFSTILESNLLNFVVATALIVYFLSKSLPESARKRKEELEREIAAATKAKEEAQAKLEELDREIERSKIEAQQIVVNAKANAEKLKMQLMTETQMEVERLHSQASREIEMQRVQTIESLRKEIAISTATEIERLINDKKTEFEALIQTKLNSDLEKLKTSV